MSPCLDKEWITYVWLDCNSLSVRESDVCQQLQLYQTKSLMKCHGIQLGSRRCKLGQICWKLWSPDYKFFNSASSCFSSEPDVKFLFCSSTKIKSPIIVEITSSYKLISSCIAMRHTSLVKTISFAYKNITLWFNVWTSNSAVIELSKNPVTYKKIALRKVSAPQYYA